MKVDLRAPHSELSRGVPVRTGVRHRITVVPPAADILRLDQFSFAFNSCVLLPRPDPRLVSRPVRTGLTLVADVLAHAERHPEKKLILAGHTDSVGSDGSNQKLSKERAANVHAYLLGDPDQWAAACNARFSVTDYQIILTWLAEEHGFACDPGPVDGKYGSRTQRGLDNFRYEFERLAVFSCRTPQESSKIGVADYRAFYELYEITLARLLGIETVPRMTPGVPGEQEHREQLDLTAQALFKVRKALRFGPTPKVGCGEAYPLMQPGTAPANRRVEALFFDESQLPAVSEGSDGSELYGPARVAPRHVKPRKRTYPVGSVKHVFVMAGGTTDPVNVESASHRSHSFSALGEQGLDPHDEAKVPPYWTRSSSDAVNEQNFYWGTDGRFRSALSELVTATEGLHLFRGHAWDGDNRIQARREAGEQLMRDLLEEYAEHKAQQVVFHPIGHSHGGNVINEFTKTIAKAGEWPKTWKIGSVTYLSTPFFQRLHQLDTTCFLPESRLIVVNNKFDLTQRIVANFTVPYLAALVEQRIPLISQQIGLGVDAVLAELKVLGVLLAKLTVSSTSALPLELIWTADAFASAARVFDLVAALIADVRLAIQSLCEMKREPDQDAKVAKTTLMSASIGARWGRELTKHETYMRTASKMLSDKSQAGLIELYRADLVDTLADVLLDFAQPFLTWLDFDLGSLRGGLLDLLFATVKDFVVEFDNTLTTPNHQLTGSVRPSVHVVDVSSADELRRRAPHVEPLFDAWIARMEDAEKGYVASETQKPMLDLVLLIAMQNRGICQLLADMKQAADEYRTAINLSFYLGKTGQFLEKLVAWLEKINLLQVRHEAGPIEQKIPVSEGMLLGDFNYLARVSHSVSRRQLHEQVGVLLRQALRAP